MLTDLCPPALDSISTPEEDEAYQKWHKADEMAKYYILASMSNVLQQQHESMATTYDIIFSLKEMFAKQGRAAR